MPVRRDPDRADGRRPRLLGRTCVETTPDLTAEPIARTAADALGRCDAVADLFAGSGRSRCDQTTVIVQSMNYNPTEVPAAKNPPAPAPTLAAPTLSVDQAIAVLTNPKLYY